MLEKFKLADVAIKVVGVGSVGTRCAVALMMAGGDDSLFLQIKEARASVLEPYAGRSHYQNHGERVVEGQRLMQSASDIFLGWSKDPSLGVEFYVRQLRDCKTAANIDTMDYPHLLRYGYHCGAALARAHAKAGDAAAIAGYIGKSKALDKALASLCGGLCRPDGKGFQATKGGRGQRTHLSGGCVRRPLGARPIPRGAIPHVVDDHRDFRKLGSGFVARGRNSPGQKPLAGRTASGA